MDKLILLCSLIPKIFPVLQDGRVKPFAVYLDEISKELSLSQEDSCLLNFSSYGFIKDFYMKGSGISYTDLINSSEITDQDQLRVKNYHKISEGASVFFYKNSKFVPIKDFLEETEVKENGLLSIFQKSFEDYKSLHKLYPLYLEFFLVKGKLVFFTFLFNLLSCFLFFMNKKRIFQKTFFITTFLFFSILLMRVVITSRGPVTNMYETVLFAGFIGLLLGIILRNSYYSLASLIFSLLSLGFVLFSKNMVSSKLENLMPILRDNFWLSTHVTTVVSSYGAFALSWILSFIFLLKKDFSRQSVNQVHKIIFIGVALLATGILLGGFWADKSWGRFWAWDPKETWSLIVLLTYGAIIHGYLAGKFTPFFYLFFSVGAFLTVLMSWFGVNYILSSGLHSYGFSQGGALFLSVLFVLHIIVLIYFYIKRPIQ